MNLKISIPYEKYKLDNGLTLIVHEDHKAPIVAVNLWYHVGSKNEKPGKTGFAHLFEHLMFNGSEHFDDDYLEIMESIGATDVNGSTSEDRTNYFQNVPTSALDVALWMESERMGHLLGGLTQKKIDDERGVVINEKQQFENEPYGIVDGLILKNIFTPGHPYSWPIIGEIEDLKAAKFEDFQTWFKTYYGTANTVLVIAGDIEPKKIRKQVEKYFGDIPSGPPLIHHQEWIGKRSTSHRLLVSDRVPQSRIYRAWNVPQWGTTEGTYLDLVADILSTGRNSRFYKRLVYEDQLATSAHAYIDLCEIAGIFYVEASARPGENLSRVESILNEELQRFLQDGPTEVELQRVKIQYLSNFVQKIERIGGFGGKSDILAKGETFAGNPDYYQTFLQRIHETTAQQLIEVARKWLSNGDFMLEVQPFPEYKTGRSRVDRSRIPIPAKTPRAKFPHLEHAKLSNGLEIILAQHDAVPVVTMNLVVDAGYAADQNFQPGTTELAINMLDEGTHTRTSLAINEAFSLLGADLGSGSNLDTSGIYLTVLKENLSAALDIYADIIQNPIFPEKDFYRLKKLQLIQIKREKSSPSQIALRLFPEVLYGTNHIYGKPFTGSGFETTVAKITREDLIKFHQTWIHPANSKLIVVGSITPNEIVPQLEAVFKNWKPGPIQEKLIQPVDFQSPQIYLMDKPGSLQSLVISGHIAPPKAHPDEIAFEIFNNILGGNFTSRLNLNLREAKGWSYGIDSSIIDARGQQPFLIYAPVQTDKTAESILEIMKELHEIKTNRPVNAEEFIKARDNQILQLPGAWETKNAIAYSIHKLVRFGLSDDYYQTYTERVESLTLDKINDAGQKLVHPDKLVWIIIGDREQIEKNIQGLNLGKLKFIDSDGNLAES
ncbi:insulinase family protein [candidate division KSB1 bacterium]|nr:insulinase family protein [candidate division KSB1 bacterium]